jgi:hypothetical protein
VVVAGERQRHLDAGASKHDRAAVGADTDAGQRHAAMPRGRQHAALPAPLDGKQQLVIVAARQRLVHRGLPSALERAARALVDRQRVGVDRNADAARVRDAVHAVGQAVAEIDAGGRCPIPAQPHAQSHARIGAQVGSRQS